MPYPDYPSLPKSEFSTPYHQKQASNPLVSNHLIPSNQEASLDKIVASLKEKISARGDLPHVSIKQQLALVDALTLFPFGQYILERRGASGFWTDYLMSHPKQGRLSGLNSEGKPFTDLEDFILNRSLVTTASQKRFELFQKLTQDTLQNHMVLASIPCGIMRDLLTLDFSDVSHVKFLGIDIDAESLFYAEALAKEMGLLHNLELLQDDAWQLNLSSTLDLITSSGLNVYERDRSKVLDLYRRFYQALKPGGLLITSVLKDPSEWNIDDIPSEDLFLEKVLYEDILDLKWRNYRKHEEIESEFKEAGFSIIEIHYDTYGVFPTVVAKKSL
ncbi:MAG: class I SAM-dependent methyltransferase [Simkania sp.]|nr:class I SAM-dependent methyltransferase [Simkania sp.]